MTKQRGRKAARAIETVEIVAPNVSALERLEPPYELWRDEEQEVWRRVVADLPAEWISGRNLDLLVEYCTAVVSARRIAQLLQEMESKEGAMKIGDWSKLLRAHSQQVSVIKSLATSMRLTQQSTYGPRAGHTALEGVVTRKPWENDPEQS